MNSIMTWQELLVPVDVGRADVLGPYTQEFVSATVALHDAAWFAHAGEPLGDHGVERVTGWEAALRVFREPKEIYWEGHLATPMWLVVETLDKHPDRREWVTRANRAALMKVNVHGHTPRAIAVLDGMLLGDHVHEYFELLLGEIALQDILGCTYFRQQLEWWHAGRFPCGWVGDWPAGKMRVL